MIVTRTCLGTLAAVGTLLRTGRATPVSLDRDGIVAQQTVNARLGLHSPRLVRCFMGFDHIPQQLPRGSKQRRGTVRFHIRAAQSIHADHRCVFAAPRAALALLRVSVQPKTSPAWLQTRDISQLVFFDPKPLKDFEDWKTRRPGAGSEVPGSPPLPLWQSTNAADALQLLLRRAGAVHPVAAIHPAAVVIHPGAVTAHAGTVVAVHTASAVVHAGTRSGRLIILWRSNPWCHYHHHYYSARAPDRRAKERAQLSPTSSY